jgi:hypothetical protein
MKRQIIQAVTQTTTLNTNKLQRVYFDANGVLSYSEIFFVEVLRHEYV